MQPTGGPTLRVFAHGSLVFHRADLDGPASAARLEGWSRVFGHPSVRNWGRPDWPAPTSCLVPGGSVDGMLYEVPDPDGTVLAGLRRREAADPIAVTIRLAGRPLPALTWRMSDTWASREVPELVAAAAHNVRAGGGPFGDAWAYVDGIVRALGPVRDPHLAAYHRHLRATLGHDRGPNRRPAR